MTPPEVARFAHVFPAPSGDVVLVALDADAAARLDIPGAMTLRGLVPPWALVAWLRPAALRPLLTPEASAAVAQRAPGRWLLVAANQRLTLERLEE